jgi:limonene-1,2-epoxide hydrolase
MRPGDCVTVKFLAHYELDGEGRVRVLKTMTWPPGKGVTRLPLLGAHPSQLAAYQAYSAAFSAGDPERYTRFYTQDVVLELPKVPPIRGREGIAAFYTEMFTRVRESLTIHAIDATDERIVADTTSRFTAVADAPDFVVGALKAGEWIEVRVHVTYALRGGLIEHIAVPRAGEPVFGGGVAER